MHGGRRGFGAARGCGAPLSTSGARRGGGRGCTGSARSLEEAATCSLNKWPHIPPDRPEFLPTPPHGCAVFDGGNQASLQLSVIVSLYLGEFKNLVSNTRRRSSRLRSSGPARRSTSCRRRMLPAAPLLPRELQEHGACRGFAEDLPRQRRLPPLLPSSHPASRPSPSSSSSLSSSHLDRSTARRGATLWRGTVARH